MGLTRRCPTLWLLTVRSSDPNETTSSLRVASTYVVLRAALKRPKEALAKSTGPFAKRSPASENPGLSHLPTYAPASCGPRIQKKPQKDNLKMTPRATRQISQVTSHHSTRDRAATSRAACFTAQLSSAENPSRQRVKLIHGSAIKTSSKRPRISKLQNSNRR